MIQGDRRSDFAADMEDVAVSLGVAPFPKTDTFRRIRTFEGSVAPRELILQEFAAVRDKAKSGDTFVLFVTAHGDIYDRYNTSQGRLLNRNLNGTPEEIAATYRLVCETGADNPVSFLRNGHVYESDFVDVNEFDFSPCKACRIVLWIDTCFSGNWIPLLRPKLEALKERDILILTSANQQRTAEGIVREGAIDTGGELFALPVGGLFTDGLVEGLRRVRGSDAAETGADALAAAFPFAASVAGAKNLESGQEYLEYDPRSDVERSQQYPQMFRRPLEPDAVCGKGDGTIDVK